MHRRCFLQAGAAASMALARPARAQGNVASANRSVLRFVPSANLTLLDPVFSTPFVSICHGYAVFDTLYGADATQTPKAQMLAGHDISADGLAWSMRLREGLRFHDGAPVRAADCAASLARWATHNATGQMVGAYVESWSSTDDSTIRVTLKRKLPTLAYLLANSVFPPFVMPERVIRAAGDGPVREIIGSGPFRFVAGEYVSGSKAVYERFEGYAPRSEPPAGTAGGKLAKVDRLEWHVIPDKATAVAALQAGEVDWLEAVPADLLPLLKSRQDIALDVIDPSGWTGLLRLNELQKPFDNATIRRAVLMAVDQSEYLAAAIGDDAAAGTVCKAVFPCGTPLGRPLGADAMRGDPDAARKLLAEGGYGGEKVVILQPTDVPPYGDYAAITADLLRRIGMNVELVATDWGTVTQRRANRGPVEQGGWSIFVVGVNGPALLNPAFNFLVRGQGERGYFGWYRNDEVERLTADWLQADTDAERNRLADAIQAIAFETVPYVPLGQFTVRTAYRRDVRGVLHGPAVLPWNVARL
jgi:peptide/nickel transport system substrate-binding protein